MVCRQTDGLFHGTAATGPGVNATEQQWGRSRRPLNIALDVGTLPASSGGRKARSYLPAGLPPEFPASALVVQRLRRKRPCLPIDIRGRSTALMARQTVDGDVLLPANAFTPAPDGHLPVRPGGTVSQAPEVQFVRPLYASAFALRTLAEAPGGW